MSIKVFMNKYPSYSLSQIERLAFIDIRLHYLGEIARSDIMEEFKLAQAAASKDLSEYRKLQGDKVKKDFQTKKTVINEEYFSPLFEIRVDYALDILTNGFNRNYLIETSPTIPLELQELCIKIKGWHVSTSLHIVKITVFEHCYLQFFLLTKMNGILEHLIDKMILSDQVLKILNYLEF